MFEDTVVNRMVWSYASSRRISPVDDETVVKEEDKRRMPRCEIGYRRVTRYHLNQVENRVRAVRLRPTC